uniref:Secreted protein n=1 Tax=Romanomermis culicivorax TaxID=13658 RepID=A0A915JAS8_ROMCU
MLSSMSLRNSFICVAETIRLAAGGSSPGASGGAGGGSLAMLRSKISVSRSLSSDGSGAVGNRGHSSNSSAVNACTEAIVGNGYG